MLRQLEVLGKINAADDPERSPAGMRSPEEEEEKTPWTTQTAYKKKVSA